MFKRFFGSIVDVRRGEVTLTLLMFLYYYTLLVTYYFLKPARDSLFLVKLGAEQLPVVFMITALVVVPVITIYSRAGRTLKLNQLINVTTIVLIVCLFILRWLLEFSHASVFYIFYTWVSIYGALSTSQFWLLANGVFDATQAKRLFVLFGLGGIVGAFTGGEVTSIFVNQLGVSTENLLFFCMGFLTLCIFLVNIVWRRRGTAEPTKEHSRRREEKKESYAEIFRTIKKSRHLLLIVGIIATTMATASFVDYQFKTVSVDSFPTKQELTSFLGKFYGRLSLISFLFQLLISYRFLRWFGVGGAILLLPLGLLGGTVLMLLVPGLMAATLLRGADGVFKYSIDKTGRELLFLPVPLEVKKRTKVFIDIFVDRWFRGFAGAILLLFVSVLHFSARDIGWVVLVLLAIWLYMVFLMRKEYVNAFRKALERREIDLSEIRVNIAESSTINSLKRTLEGGSDRQIVYALEMMKGVQDASVLGAIKPLLLHGSTDVRRAAVAILREQDDDGFRTEMEELIRDEDPQIRIDAVDYLCKHGDGIETLKQHLDSDDPRVHSAAIGCVALYGGPSERALVTEPLIESLVSQTGEDGAEARAQAADVLGYLNEPRFHRQLLALLDDSDTQVVARAIDAAGKTADRDFVPRLIELLAETKHRARARAALSQYGDRIVGTVTDYIIDRSLPLPLRSNLCRVLGNIPTQHSVDTLIGAIGQVEPEVRYHVIKALNALRSRYPDLRFNSHAINGALIDETETYYAILQLLQIDNGKDAGGQLLQKALSEKIDQNLERIFRLLSLSYSGKDMLGAYLGITGERKELKASAVELLDNVLRKEVKKYLFPIVDTVEIESKIRAGTELFGTLIRDRNAGLDYLLKGNDPWLKTCALFSMQGDVPAELRDAVDACRRDAHPVVKETADLVLAA